METAIAHDLVSFLEDEQTRFVDLLVALARAESPSTVASAQRPAQDLLANALDETGFEVRRIRGRETGDHLMARSRPRVRGVALQMLLGHSDTVWPLGTLEEMPVSLEDGVLKGPGVYDMKAGLTQIVFALRALRALGLNPPCTPIVFINSDEEIGSRESGRHIRRLARHVNRAFVLEPSFGREGKLKTQRKGIGRFTIHIAGKPAHAGLDPTAGASAILELSHLIQRLFALNDAARGITINVGVVDGGLQPNVVAPESRAVVDVRVLTNDDARWVERTMHALEAETPGTRLRVEGGIGRPPMEPTPGNRMLWQVARSAAAAHGLDLDETVVGGGSDGNTTSQYTPTLDGLGAVGGGAHAHHEFVFVDRLIERCALLASLLLAAPLPNPDR